MGVITKIKMARDWRISVVFLLHLVGVRESAFVERLSSYGNCGARQCENGDDKFCMKQVDESTIFLEKRTKLTFRALALPSDKGLMFEMPTWSSCLIPNFRVSVIINNK